MDNSLAKLLGACSDGNSKDYTHYSFFGPSKNWALSDLKYEQFWKQYCELAENPEVNENNLCLAETNKKYMPIVADFNLKFHPLEDNIDFEDLYDEEFILSIVYCYQQIIKETLNISQRGIEFLCCVLKSKPYMENDLIVCKIRLQFPYCKTISKFQNSLMRPLILQMFRTRNVIGKLPSQPVNDWEEILDPLTVERPLLMYGSSAAPGIPKLHLDYCLRPISEENIKNRTFPLIEIEEMFFPENHEHAMNGIIPLDNFFDEDGNCDKEFWLPYFLSIYYVKETILPRKTEDVSMNVSSSTSSMKISSKSIKIINNSFEDEDKDGPDYLSTIFLNLLSKKRSEEENYWLDVGKALHCAFEGDDRGLEKWIDFSEQNDVFTREDCTKKYINFTEKKITLKTLAFYAREDSPEEYAKWHESWYQPSLEKATSCAHSDVAEALYKVYWLEIGCSNLGKNNVYIYKNHVWKKMDCGHILKQLISGDFLKIVEKFRADVAVQIKDSQDKNFKDSAEILIQKICKLITKLKNRAFKSSIFSESIEKFYIEGFEQYLDTDPDLMGCLNGVIQCLDKKAIFRDGKPEDYVSRTTGVYWRHDLKDDHPLVIKLMSYLTKVFPDKELLNYFGKIMAASLRGRNSEKIFPIHTGKGNNSKSMIKKLLEATFGDYCVTIPTSVFTSSKNGGGPDPAVARCKYAHLAFAQEPDAETPFRAGTIKEMTGGDRFFARFLHDNGEEIIPMFTLQLMCNNIPAFTDVGEAVKARTLILPYLSTWISDPPKTTEEQYAQRKFLKDPNFETQIPEMGIAMLWWLVNRKYADYKREGAVTPPIVKQYTNEYWEENDFYNQFIKENIERAYKLVPEGYTGKVPLDETSYVSLADMYKRFKEWFQENYKIRVPERAVFKTEIENRVTKCVQRNFYGIKFKVNVAEI